MNVLQVRRDAAGGRAATMVVNRSPDRVVMPTTLPGFDGAGARERGPWEVAVRAAAPASAEDHRIRGVAVA